MAEIKIGDRVGKNGRLGIGCSASVFDIDRKKMLFVRRADNRKWAVPGGYMDSGEAFVGGRDGAEIEKTSCCVTSIP